MSALLPRFVIRGGQIGALAVALSACAMTGDFPTSSLPYNTLVPGWESKFALEWKAAPVKDGTTVLYGRITGRSGQFAPQLRLLAQSVDSSGAAVGNRIAWVQGGVPGFGSVYFEIDRVKAAESYRIGVWDYTFLEGQGPIP